MKWSRQEDYIVCKFSYEHAWKAITVEQLNGLMLKLQQQGFGQRSKIAVDKRIRDYQRLFCYGESHYATDQVLLTYQSFLERINNPSLYKSIKSFVEENFDPNEAKPADIISGERSNLESYIHKIDYCSTFPMVLQKFIDQKGFKKHKEIYDKISMKQDTFSSILRGKYTVVKKENVLRLCVGLNLSVDEAEELVESAGYLFSRGIMTDVVVKAYLVHRCYDTFAIDSELCENNVPALFAAA
jgi:hypothetical protein